STGNDQVLTALKITPSFNVDANHSDVKQWGLFVEQGNVAIANGSLAIGTEDPAEHKLKLTGGSTLLEGIVTVAPTLEGTNHGAQITPTLTSTGNDQVLTALKITPSFNVDANHSDVKQWGLFVEQGNVAIANGSLAIGTEDPAEHKLKLTGGSTLLEGIVTVAPTLEGTNHGAQIQPTLTSTGNDQVLTAL
ncbi:MAG: hypothetical protein F6K58_07485, partial [Symploca sp. SIO2E9]|nr:hypothetical protein [Symploca sp. SIO2E9]